MKKFFLSIYDKLSPRRGVVICFSAILAAVCLALAFRLDYQEDISAFLPLDEQTAKYSAVYNNLGGHEKVAVIFRSSEKNEASRVEHIQHAMDSFGEILQETDTIGVVKNLQTQVDESGVLDVLEFIWKNYPYMLTDDECAHVDSMLDTPAYYGEQMEGNRQILMLPTSAAMSQSLPYDPLHISAAATSGLKEVKVGDAFQVIDGYIFTKECDKGLIYFESPFGISESRKNAQLVSVMDSALVRFNREHAELSVKVSSIGAPLIAVTNAQQIKHDSILAVGLAVLLISLVLICSFRRFSDIFWVGFSIAIGWLFAIGCISLLKDSISIIIIGIGSVIIGIAVNYPLHFIDHLKHESDKRQVLKDMLQPLLIGNITTVSAFLCLVLLDAEAMRDLGIFSSLMLIGTILFVLIVLPVLAPTRKQGGKERSLGFESLVLKRIPALRRFLPWTVAAITTLLFYFSLNTSFDSDMQHINYMTAEQRQNLKVLTSSLESADSLRLLYVVAEGRDMEEALVNNEALLDSLDRVKAIRHISGLGRYVPSKKKQEENLKRWHHLWENHPDATLQMHAACVAAGFSESAFAPFAKMREGDMPLRDVEDFINVMPMITENFILHNEEGVRIVNFVHITAAQYDEAKQTVRSVIPAQAFAFDASDMSNHLVTLLSDSFNYIGFVCGFVVFLFLWLSFGRIELSLLSFLPLAVSWIWILGMMDLCNIQFNIVNIILATFIFGQGDDYTIFITEGLMYEYANGKKQIQAYKNSVALSAIIMFIGLGTLIVAKHPAMRSLAEVAIVGMITVVAMAFYLPPFVYKWLTTKQGKVREYPLTLKRIVYSLYAFGAFLVGLVGSLPVIYVYFIFVKKQEKRSLFIHKILQRFSHFVVHRVPGAPFKIVNTVGEDFSRPALIICNHQSQLDLVAVMSVAEKITILTKDWVWNNPFYGRIIRASEFYPVTNGVENYVDDMKDMIRRGYSIVVFPEGTRSSDGILRFHKGAFMLAQELGLDILPLYLHGFNDVLPRHDFMLREGSMTMEVGQRMPAEEVMAQSSMSLRKHFHTQYVNHFDEMRRKYETSAYFIPFVRYKFMYKGTDIEHRTRRILKDKAAMAQLIDRDFSSVESYSFDEPGQGEIPYIMAKVHPNIEVYADFTDEDDYLVASHLQGLPENLHLYLTQPVQYPWM